MEDKKDSDRKLRYIRITTPTEEDVGYARRLLEGGAVKDEDIRPNMSLFASYHGLEESRQK